jgi:hypothetical protein
MRLQLTVHRHGLPAVHILWNVSHSNPFQPPAPALGSLTNTLDITDGLEASSTTANGENAVQLHSSTEGPLSRAASSSGPIGRWAGAGGHKTIAQLLEDVNAVIPLESQDGEGDEWGLEDYVVRVGGHECLHFEFVGNVLREGDGVL